MRPRSSDMLIVQFWSYGEVRVGKIDPTRSARINASYTQCRSVWTASGLVDPRASAIACNPRSGGGFLQCATQASNDDCLGSLARSPINGVSDIEDELGKLIVRVEVPHASGLEPGWSGWFRRSGAPSGQGETIVECRNDHALYRD